MYKIVFLLIFSAATELEAKEILLNLNDKYNPKTGRYDVKCEVKNAGIQTVSAEEKIAFNIETKHKLNDFWCHNSNDKLIYSFVVPEPKHSYESYQYTLPETSVGSKSDMEGTWKCTTQVLKKVDSSEYEQLENFCYFQLKIVDQPRVSLEIAQLREWDWINEKQGRKRYNHTFIEGDAKFDCVLNNPTGNEETYKMYFFIDEPKTVNKKEKLTKKVTLQPHQKDTLPGTFNLNSVTKRILCKAVNVKGDGMDMENEINLHYIPPSRVILNMQALGSKTLKMGTLFRANNTQMYDFEFTDGEQVEIECALNDAKGDEKNYGLTLCIKRENCTTSESYTSVSHTFELEKEDQFIQCMAVNKKKSTDLSLPSYLYSIVNLLYTPPSEVTGATTPLLRFTEPEKLQRNGAIYSYNFTDGETITLNCSSRKAGNYIYFYLKTAFNATDSKYDIITPEKDSPNTSIKQTFTLKSNYQAIICATYDGNMKRKHSIKVILHERPQAMLSITGPEKLQRWSNTKYHYNFTDGEIIELKCSLNNAVGNKENYDIAFYNYNKWNDSNKFITSSKILNTSTYIRHTFTIKKEDTAISCALFEINDDNESVLKYSLELRLHYFPGSTQDILTFNVDGSSELQDLHRNDSVLQYIYEFTNDETVKVTASLNVTEGNKDIYEIEFYLDGKTYKQSRESKVLRDESQSKMVAYKLNKRNKIISCVVRNKNKGKPIIRVVNLKYNNKKIGSGLELIIQGLPEDNCRPTDEIYKTNKVCHYAFGDPNLIGRTLTLHCVLSGLTKSSRPKTYAIQFGTNTTTAELKKNVNSSKSVEYSILRTKENKTVICNASGGQYFETVIFISYIPRITASTTTPEPPNKPTTATNQVTSTDLAPSDAMQSNPGEGADMAWLKWVLGGGALLITVCVVVGCIVMHRRKKPPPAESTYANLGKDQNNYQTMPVAAPRSMQKPNVTKRSDVAGKPKVSVETHYSEPKDSQDISESLYADPNRFNGDSQTYAEPYVKSKPCPKSDTYAEPYASSSEVNYAELSLPTSKELYARPIPKAQRKPKVKDECNYSNVFGDQYANMKK